MLDNPGLEKGAYYNSWAGSTNGLGKIAQKYIIEYYGSHQNARRLATYLVKNNKL